MNNNIFSFDKIKSIYFIGAGGIGMSALIRYFLSKQMFVGGYDLTPTELTKELINEGADIHYEDNVELIPKRCSIKENTLIVYTPAIPASHTELCYFRTKGFNIMKRSQLLGFITHNTLGLCIAGTHGKTSTSSLLAHILKESRSVDCTAFLGGILKGYDSNLLLADNDSSFTVIEADEYDRSFHALHPYMAVITSADPDHLDIYGDEQTYLESFEYFTSLIRSNGVLLIKKGLSINPQTQENVRIFSYAADAKADYYAENIKITNGSISFDFVGPDVSIRETSLGVPVRTNIENAIAAMAIAHLCGCNEEYIRQSVASFQGVKRRFEFHLKDEVRGILIEDYAHHPEELASCIQSVKELYPEKKLTGIFQPHLFSRTRDFSLGFAKSLSLLDELYLLDIYPARELPISGVTSSILFDKISLSSKMLCSKSDLLHLFDANSAELILMVGAGDITDLVEPIKQKILTKN